MGSLRFSAILPQPSRSSLVARGLLCVALAALAPSPLPAQQDPGSSAARERLTREEAVQRALAQGPRAVIAAAASRAAQAGLLSARAVPNPTLAASYSKAVPQYHAALDFPLDYLWLRSLRVASALSASEAAQYQLGLARAGVRLTVDTLYTRAVASGARAALSERNAADAESLLAAARVRRDAGDASELDVELARINAGQAANAAAGDSLTTIATVLDLQSALGASARDVTVELADSLGDPSLDSLARLAAAPPAGGTPLAVSAAERSLAEAEQSLALERRTVWSGFAVTAGVENHDPTGSETGVLPTVGVTLPLPLFNQHRGEIALAQANRDRVRAELELARRESELQIEQTRRGLSVAVARAQRDRALVAGAERVAQMALRAYAEGAYPLVNVLETQRNARDALAQLINDTAAAVNGAAVIAFLTATVAP